MGGEERFHHRRYLRIGVESAAATRAEILPVSTALYGMKFHRCPGGFQSGDQKLALIERHQPIKRPVDDQKGGRVLGNIGDWIDPPHLIRVILDWATDQLRFRRIRRIVDLPVRKTVRIHLEKIRRTEEIAHRLDATGVAEIFSNLKITNLTRGSHQRRQISAGGRAPDSDPVRINAELIGMRPQPADGGFAIF